MSFIQRSVPRRTPSQLGQPLRTRDMVRLNLRRVRVYAHTHARTHACTYVSARTWNGENERRNYEEGRGGERMKGTRGATFETLDVPLARVSRFRDLSSSIGIFFLELTPRDEDALGDRQSTRPRTITHVRHPRRYRRNDPLRAIPLREILRRRSRPVIQGEDKCAVRASS